MISGLNNSPPIHIAITAGPIVFTQSTGLEITTSLASMRESLGTYSRSSAQSEEINVGSAIYYFFMTENIDAKDAQERLYELIDRVEKGEIFYITENQKIIAKLQGATNSRPKFGELEPSFVDIDTDLVDEPDEELNRAFYNTQD